MLDLIRERIEADTDQPYRHKTVRRTKYIVPGLEPEKTRTDPHITDSKVTETCSICLEDDANHETECGHIFHKGCILKWLKGHNICPVCRDDLQVTTGIPIASKLFYTRLEGDKVIGTFIVDEHVEEFSLPNTEESEYVIGLLKKAFERDLLFQMFHGRMTCTLRLQGPTLIMKERMASWGIS